MDRKQQPLHVFSRIMNRYNNSIICQRVVLIHFCASMSMNRGVRKTHQSFIMVFWNEIELPSGFVRRPPPFIHLAMNEFVKFECEENEE